MKEINEIKTKFIYDQNLRHIDLYFTVDEMEEGTTVAAVCLDTNKVIYFDKKYRGVPEVDDAIAKIIESNERYVYILSQVYDMEESSDVILSVYNTPEQAAESLGVTLDDFVREHDYGWTKFHTHFMYYSIEKVKLG